MRQRATGDAAVAAVEDEELARLDDTTALALTDALLSAIRLEYVEEERRTSSGLVEQQRWFRRYRR